MKLTKKALEAGKSSKGGWSNRQWNVLGVHSFKRGWMHELVGTYVSNERYEKFLALKDEHVNNAKVKSTNKGGAYKKEHSNNNSKITSFKKSKTSKIKKGKETPKSEYLDDRWIALRNKVLKRDNFTCLVCKKSGKPNYVHHWRYQGNYVWDTDTMFLATVCRDCHEKIHLAISEEI